MAEQDSDKRAEMLNVIDMRRGASLSRQSDAQTPDEVKNCHVTCCCMQCSVTELDATLLLCWLAIASELELPSPSFRAQRASQLPC